MTESPTLAYRRRKRVLGIHAALFAVLNAANIAQWLLIRGMPVEDVDPSALATFWPAWLLLVWGVVLAIHGLYVWARKPVVEVVDPGPFGWRPGRAVRTVVFTDVVGSTERAREMGDARWRTLLDRHDRLAEQLAKRSRGTVVKHIGDGLLALFDSPREAIRFATAFRDEVRDLDLQIRAGIHAGEVEVVRRDISGIGVHIASRVMGSADPSEILVSQTVRDLVAGSDVVLTDRGSRPLRGLEGEWQLFAVAEV